MKLTVINPHKSLKWLLNSDSPAEHIPMILSFACIFSVANIVMLTAALLCFNLFNDALSTVLLVLTWVKNNSLWTTIDNMHWNKKCVIMYMKLRAIAGLKISQRWRRDQFYRIWCNVCFMAELRTKFLPPFSGWSYEITMKLETTNPSGVGA